MQNPLYIMELEKRFPKGTKFTSLEDIENHLKNNLSKEEFISLGKFKLMDITRKYFPMADSFTVMEAMYNLIPHFNSMDDIETTTIKGKLDEWYNAQPFDVVYKCTGINPLDYPEYDEQNPNLIEDCDWAIKEACAIWDTFSIEKKLDYYLSEGNEPLF